MIVYSWLQKRKPMNHKKTEWSFHPVSRFVNESVDSWIVESSLCSSLTLSLSILLLRPLGPGSMSGGEALISDRPLAAAPTSWKRWDLQSHYNTCSFTSFSLCFSCTMLFIMPVWTSFRSQNCDNNSNVANAAAAIAGTKTASHPLMATMLSSSHRWAPSHPSSHHLCLCASNEVLLDVTKSAAITWVVELK